jgi:GT2 family glycosyltransferase
VNSEDPLRLPGFRLASRSDLPSPHQVPIRVVHPDSGMRLDLQPIGEVGPGWYRLELKFPMEGVVDAIVHLALSGGDQFWLRPGVLERNHFVADLRLKSTLSSITIKLTGSGDIRRPTRFNFERISRFTWLVSLARRARYVLKRDRLGVIRPATLAIFGLMRPDTIALGRSAVARDGETPYDAWIRIFDEDPARHRSWHQQRLKILHRQPLLSCLTYFASFDALAIDRVARGIGEQIYPNWQLVIACSSELRSAICDALKSRGANLRSVHFITIAADAASTWNALVAAATGDFVLQIPPGSLLPANALLELALLLDRNREVEFVYSDADRIDVQGRRSDPQFKPAWSPDYLVGTDYIGHLAVFRRQTVQRVGGWRPGLGSASDHDLKLRVTEQVQPRMIIHLAKILIHLPKSDERSSSDDYALLEDLIARRQDHAVVTKTSAGTRRLQYLTPEPQPLASLIIPTRDRADFLQVCIRSILERTLYRRYEILIIDNDSREAATTRLFERLRKEPAIRILHCSGEFNFSGLNNLATREAKGSFLAFVNNDIEVIDGGWLDEMISLAARPDTGCVGAKLLYPDGRIQHAGIAIGIGGLAGHLQRFSAGDAPGYMNQLHFTRNVSAVTAACLVVRKEVFAEVAGFDENELKVAYNDVDLCLKVREAGYLNVWTPYAELIHHESASRGFDYSPTNIRRFVREANVIRRRWGNKFYNDPYYSPHLTYDREDCSLRVR